MVIDANLTRNQTLHSNNRSRGKDHSLWVTAFHRHRVKLNVGKTWNYTFDQTI